MRHLFRRFRSQHSHMRWYKAYQLWDTRNTFSYSFHEGKYTL